MGNRDSRFTASKLIMQKIAINLLQLSSFDSQEGRKAEEYWEYNLGF